MEKPSSNMQTNGINGARPTHTGTADLFYDMVSIPAFVYNFAEDRYLWISKSLEVFVDREKCLQQGVRAWSGSIHPEDFGSFCSAHLTELKKLCVLKMGESHHRAKVVSFRLAKRKNEWIPAIVKADIVGYDTTGHASCIFGLLLTQEFHAGDWNAADPAPNEDELAAIPVQGNITNRELEVLTLLRKGKSSREISEGLAISFHTVESYRKRLLQKFNVRNTPELIAKSGVRYAWSNAT